MQDQLIIYQRFSIAILVHIIIINAFTFMELRQYTT